MATLEDFFSKTFVSRKIGTFVLDATTDESHQSQLKVTKNPIESGGVIADHAYLLPGALVIRGIIVDYEVEQVSTLIGKLTSIEGIAGVLGDVVSGDFDPFDEATQDKLLESAQVVIGDIVLGAIRNIAPWLPGVLGKVLDIDGEEAPSRIRKLYAELESIQSSGEMLTVITKAKIYNDMVLTGIAAITNNDNVLEVVLSFENIQVTAEQLVVQGGLTGGEADMRSKKGKGGKDGKDDSADPSGDAGKDTKKPVKVEHESVVERMRGQVEAELGKLKGRMGF